MSGKIIVFSGFSGVGKNTIINALRSRYSSLVYIPSMTTRDMREGESEGFPYFFVSKEEFMERVKNGHFIEYEQIHGNWYGTPKDKYHEAIRNNQIVVKDIDVNGAMSMKEEFGNYTVLIYIEPPSIDELKKRLVTRGDDMDDIIRRLKRVDYELSKKPMFDEWIVNENLEKAIEECDEILQKYTGEIAPAKYRAQINTLVPTRPMSSINMEKVAAIKDAIISADDIPYPKIYKENGIEYIIDGHHRILGYYAAGKKSVDVDVISKDELNGKLSNFRYSPVSEWDSLLKEATQS
jgi:guanylate kinase